MPLWTRALGSTMYSSWEDECGGQPTTAATREFVHLLQHSTSVVAVLCGHIHQAQAHYLNPKYSSVGSEAAASGGVMLVTAATTKGGRQPAAGFRPRPGGSG